MLQSRNQFKTFFFCFQRKKNFPLKNGYSDNNVSEKQLPNQNWTDRKAKLIWN